MIVFTSSAVRYFSVRVQGCEASDQSVIYDWYPDTRCLTTNRKRYRAKVGVCKQIAPELYTKWACVKPATLPVPFMKGRMVTNDVSTAGSNNVPTTPTSQDAAAAASAEKGDAQTPAVPTGGSVNPTSVPSSSSGGTSSSALAEGGRERKNAAAPGLTIRGRLSFVSVFDGSEVKMRGLRHQGRGGSRQPGTDDAEDDVRETEDDMEGLEDMTGVGAGNGDDMVEGEPTETEALGMQEKDWDTLGESVTGPNIRAMVEDMAGGAGAEGAAGMGGAETPSENGGGFSLQEFPQKVSSAKGGEINVGQPDLSFFGDKFLAGDEVVMPPSKSARRFSAKERTARMEKGDKAAAVKREREEAQARAREEEEGKFFRDSFLSQDSPPHNGVSSLNEHAARRWSSPLQHRRARGRYGRHNSRRGSEDEQEVAPERKEVEEVEAPPDDRWGWGGRPRSQATRTTDPWEDEAEVERDEAEVRRPYGHHAQRRGSYEENSDDVEDDSESSLEAQEHRQPGKGTGKGGATPQKGTGKGSIRIGGSSRNNYPTLRRPLPMPKYDPTAGIPGADPNRLPKTPFYAVTK